jgi:hypothetical protein
MINFNQNPDIVLSETPTVMYIQTSEYRVRIPFEVSIYVRIPV